MAAYIRPALEAGLIEMTIPDKPNSSNQRYRLTPKGREFLASGSGENREAADHASGHTNDHDHANGHATGHVAGQVND